MKTYAIALFFGVLAVNASGAAPAGLNLSTRKAIVLNYAGIDAAFHSKSVDALFRYLMPNYTIYQNGTVITAATNRQAQAQWFAEADTLTSRSIVQKMMTMQGQAVMVTITQEMTDRVFDSTTGNTETDGYVFQEKDLWVRTSSGWRIQNTHVISEADTVNGQPIRDAAPPTLS